MSYNSQFQIWLDRSDRGVSPVVGVVLMVAITVILAAVIGTFVLGLGGNLEETPPTSTIIVQDHPDAFDETSTDQPLFRIYHQGGEGIPASGVVISIRNESTGSVVAEWRGGAWIDEVSGQTTRDLFNGGNGLTPSDTIGIGDRLTINRSSPGAGYYAGSRYAIVITDQRTNQVVDWSTIRLQ